MKMKPSNDAPDAAISKKPTLEQRVFAAQIHTLYESMRFPLIASVAAMVVVVLVCQMWTGWQVTLIWAAAMTLVLGVRFYGLQCYMRVFVANGSSTRKMHPLAKRWAAWCVLGSAVTGALWGAGGVVFFPEYQVEHQFFLILILIGIVTAAAFAQISYLPAFRLYVLGMAIPMTLVMLYQADLMQTVFAVLCVMYTVVLHHLVVIANQRLLQTFRLRFQTQALSHQLSEQVRRADDANLAKSQFLTAASHDLRQPLHAMELFASALDFHDMESSARVVVGKLGKSISAMRSLLDALMDISRLDAGVVQAQVGKVGLRRLIDGIAEEFIPVAAEKGLLLSYRCPADATTLTDAVLLRSILMNFVSNAVRYTNKGRILITCRPVRGQWQLAVHDTGQGIAPEQQPLLFKEFVQLGNCKHDHNAGLGLGLAIIKRQSALLGHSVALRSRLGHGSRFAICVPQTYVATPAPLQGTAMPDHLGRFGVSRLVVVVDDDKTVLDAMALLLQSWGFQVVTAVSAKLAIHAMATVTQKPALLLCDWQLGGGVNGMQAIATLREFCNNDALPAALITGATDSAHLSAAHGSGVPVLSKPVRAGALRAQMVLLLDGHHGL